MSTNTTSSETTGSLFYLKPPRRFISKINNLRFANSRALINMYIPPLDVDNFILWWPLQNISVPFITWTSDVVLIVSKIQVFTYLVFVHSACICTYMSSHVPTEAIYMYMYNMSILYCILEFTRTIINYYRLCVCFRIKKQAMSYTQ